MTKKTEPAQLILSQEKNQAKQIPLRLRTLANLLISCQPSKQLATEINQTITYWEQSLLRTPNPDTPPPTTPHQTPSSTIHPPESIKEPEIQAWCDGSCSPNPGPGGWGVLIHAEGKKYELSGATHNSTNNIMELTAAIQAITPTQTGCHLIITTDSRYLIEGITRWLPRWKKNGWRKADGKPVLNQKIWHQLDALCQTRTIHWNWIPAHTGHPENELCDQLANLARLKLK